MRCRGRSDARCGDHADGESATDESADGCRVIYLVGDRSGRAGGREGAVDGHPYAPARWEVDKTFRAELRAVGPCPARASGRCLVAAPVGGGAALTLALLPMIHGYGHDRRGGRDG